MDLYQEAATRNPDSDTLAYNLGNTLYSLGRYDEAAKQYGRILEKDKPALTSRSLYNMGNSLFRMGRQSNNQQMLQQSLNAYKNSIVKNPEDEDSKYNYELVKKYIKEEEQQQQQNQDNQEKQENKDQQQQQQQPQNQDNQDKKKQQQQQQQQQKEQTAEEPRQEQLQPGQMSQEEAERILEVMQRKEQELKENEQKAVARKRSRGPDW